MEQDTKPKSDPNLPDNVEELIETPLFSRFKVWWRAKKVSLNLFGFEKYLGCDSTQFRAAITQYKSLLEEVELEYKENLKNTDLTPEEAEEAKQHRESMLLDAKKDFVYHMPEDYRIWFKKNKVYSSWRHAPEAWGFEESRYWGSRSGLSLTEKRFVGGGILVGIGLVFVLVYATATSEKTEAPPVKVLVVPRDSNAVSNVDSAMQAAQRMRAKNAITERNNIVVNQINNGTYMTIGSDPQAEIRMIMSIYYLNQLGQSVPEWDLPKEGVNLSTIIVGGKNGGMVLKRDALGVPTQWKVNARIAITWNDIQLGVAKNDKIRASKRK